MRHLGHLSSDFIKLLSAIHANGGVPCERNPDVFYPEDVSDPYLRNTYIILAKTLCDSCPIKLQCFEYALETGQEYGIWGGTTAKER
jgi:WhiB family redox-sensing transcriptional regulator